MEKNETLELQKNKIIQIVCFYLDQEEYALSIDQIQEVIRLADISPMPQMPKFCIGLMNMRGRVGSVFDLRDILGLSKKDFDDDTRVLDIEIHGITIGLIVDKVLENIKVDTQQIDPPPNVKMAVNKECIAGIGEHNGRLITILNLEEIYLYVTQKMKSLSGEE